MATFSTVTCYEEYGSVQETWGPDQVTCVANLRVAWASRHLLVADLLGNQRAWPYGSFAAAPRAHACAVKPVLGEYVQDTQGMQYTDALVTVNYSSLATEDLISESLEPAVEFVTLDHKRFRWNAADGDPLQEAEAPGKLLRTLNLVRTHYKVAPPLSTDIIDLPGSVNDANYVSTLLGLTFPKATLLYASPVLQRTIDSSGDLAWDITLKFSYKPEGWNKFWRPKVEDWQEIFHVDGGKYDNYPENDFSGMLY